MMDDAIGVLGVEAVAEARSSSSGQAAGKEGGGQQARPDGINRELYALLQNETDAPLPSLIPTVCRHTFAVRQHQQAYS